MAEDKREAILDRLAVVLQSCCDDPKHFFRNRIDVPENARPGIVLLDADETAKSEEIAGKKRPASGPVRVELTPEIYLLASGKPDVTGGEPAADGKAIGKALNARRAKVIKAVLTDATLIELAHDGAIRYEGFATGLAAGRSMEGEAGISFTFEYMLFPAKL